MKPSEFREHKHRHLIIWICGCILATITFLGIYVVAQQSLRQTANTPQIKIAEDTSALLDTGKPADYFTSDTKVDIAKDSDVFTIIYDSTGQPVASSGFLNGVMPVIPLGVLQASAKNGQNRITWEPQTGVRIASVTVPYANGFVVVGRSLKDTEARIDVVGSVIFWAWLTAAALVSLITGMFALFMAKCYSTPRHPL